MVLRACFFSMQPRHEAYEHRISSKDNSPAKNFRYWRTSFLLCLTTAFLQGFLKIFPVSVRYICVFRNVKPCDSFTILVFFSFSSIFSSAHILRISCKQYSRYSLLSCIKYQSSMYRAYSCICNTSLM